MPGSDVTTSRAFQACRGKAQPILGSCRPRLDRPGTASVRADPAFINSEVSKPGVVLAPPTPVSSGTTESRHGGFLGAEMGISGEDPAAAPGLAQG